MSDTRLAFDVGLPAPNGGVSWQSSDAGRPAFRVARSGCFRAAVALPRGATVGDVRALRLRAHTRPSRGNEPRLPRGAGSARIERVNLLFGLGPDDRPGPSVFSWSGGGELRPDGPPLELAVGPRHGDPRPMQWSASRVLRKIWPEAAAGELTVKPSSGFSARRSKAGPALTTVVSPSSLVR